VTRSRCGRKHRAIASNSATDPGFWPESVTTPLRRCATAALLIVRSQTQRR
jgi:hypothetical protein